MIPFNKPYLTGKEVHYIYQAVSSGKLSGNGAFTKKCQQYFEDSYRCKKCLLTTSCTDALEMAALLSMVSAGDEVIVPSYTFVSSALAFVRQGAKIVFADSGRDNPNIDVGRLESLVTPKTRVIVPVHYAGIACDMDPIMKIAERHNLLVIEDAAQGIESFYKGKPLGTIGHMAAFSFHETKNIISGEGGMICINDDRFIQRADVIWEKGTNRAAFFRGEVDKYGWVDTGSSFLPSEITAAFLYAQIENITVIQNRRRAIWTRYWEGLKPLAAEGLIALPHIPEYAMNNAHMFYLVCDSLEDRSALIVKLKESGIMAVFHYLSLHKSKYYEPERDGRALPQSDRYTDCLLRLPLYYELQDSQVDVIVKTIQQFFKGMK
ncbi:MAG: dTDP-4-amino-4,6-dideoxygalactose transaminase [Lacunisphaera sp.]